MSRWLRILDPLGKVAAFFGLLMTAPAAVSLILDDGLALTHISAAAATFAAGICITLAGRPFRRDLQARQGLLLVVVIWLLLPCFAALPLMGALPELEFSFAYFEAASGLTASGGTVLSGLDSMPPSLNFWRGEMIWIGGMGLIVLAVAIFPLIGAGGHGVFNAEMPGPMKDNKLTPRVTQTAKALWVIYAGLTCLCALAYFAAGMSGLDAVIHAFTTLGLGGFSSHDASYGYFDSAAVEGVAMVFMILAGINFTLHFSAWTGRNPLTYFRSQECRAYLWTMAAAVTAVFLHLHSEDVYGSAWETLRYAAFNTVSIVDDDGVFQRRLRVLAALCADADADFGECDRLRGVDGRRREDVANANRAEPNGNRAAEVDGILWRITTPKSGGSPCRKRFWRRFCFFWWPICLWPWPWRWRCWRPEWIFSRRFPRPLPASATPARAWAKWGRPPTTRI